ncbi:hypothetical protein ACWF94_05105 [Streptomyces sp. NPDC055078]
MCDRIVRALVWVLTVLPLTRRTRPGRHTAEYLAQHRAPAPLVICTARTPVPAHVLARSIPTPWGHRIGPWLLAKEATDRQRQRCVSAVAATLGYDVPFPFDGANVARVGVPA